MYKKLIMSCMALVAFAAFVPPASASAAQKPTLRDNSGVGAVGSLINGTASNTKFWNTATTVEQTLCSTVRMTGTLLKNGGDNVEGEITKAEFESTGEVAKDNNLRECTGSFGSAWVTVSTLPLCIRLLSGMGPDEFEVLAKGAATSCATATGKIKFIIGSTTAGECEYEAAASVKGPKQCIPPPQLLAGPDLRALLAPAGAAGGAGPVGGRLARRPATRSATRRSCWRRARSRASRG